MCKKQTKTAKIQQAMLSQSGITIDGMMKLTDWQRHTVHSVLSRVFRNRKDMTLYAEKTESGLRYFLKPIT